jgi:dTDP-glucose 4,6-dehydratase
LIAIPYSYRNPREVVDTNVLGTLNVLEAARHLHPQRLVHVSTSEVYGSAQYVPITEQHALQGQSPYSASKIAADKLVESYARAFDVPALTIRPFNNYGPRQSLRAVIPTIVGQVLFRDRVLLGSTEPTRDFLYVTDTATAMVAAAGAAHIGWTEINLGTGVEVSIGVLAQRIMTIADRHVPVVADDQRMRPVASEVDRLSASVERAAQLLGWSPTVSLDDGLERVIAWARQHPDLYDRAAEYRV